MNTILNTPHSRVNILFPGLKDSDNMFCSFSYYDNNRYSFINFCAEDKFMLYSFNFNKFYLASSSSSAYGKFLTDYIKHDHYTKRKSTSINGRFTSGLNLSFNPSMLILDLDSVDMNNIIPCPMDKFMLNLLKILISTNYDEQMTKNELITAYEKMIERNSYS